MGKLLRTQIIAKPEFGILGPNKIADLSHGLGLRGFWPFTCSHLVNVLKLMYFSEDFIQSPYCTTNKNCATLRINIKPFGGHRFSLIQAAMSRTLLGRRRSCIYFLKKWTLLTMLNTIICGVKILPNQLCKKHSLVASSRG